MDVSFVLPRPSRRSRSTAEEERPGLRTLVLSRWDNKLELCCDVRNHAWEDNWGMTKEFIVMDMDLKPLLIPEFAYMTEVNGQPASC